MTCARVKSLLPDYLRGALSDDEMSFVAQHLHQCRDCPEELASLQELYAGFDRLPFGEPSEHYWTTLLPRVHQRIEGRKDHRVPRWIPRLAFPVVLTALIVAIIVRFFVTTEADREAGQIPPYDPEVKTLVEELSSEELDQLGETSISEDDNISSVENTLSIDGEVLERVLADVRNVFSYSEVDPASVVSTWDDEDIEQLVVYLDQKRFVR